MTVLKFDESLVRCNELPANDEVGEIEQSFSTRFSCVLVFSEVRHSFLLAVRLLSHEGLMTCF